MHHHEIRIDYFPLISRIFNVPLSCICFSAMAADAVPTEFTTPVADTPVSRVVGITVPTAPVAATPVSASVIEGDVVPVAPVAPTPVSGTGAVAVPTAPVPPTPVRATVLLGARVPTLVVPATPVSGMTTSDPSGANPSSILPSMERSEPSCPVNPAGGTGGVTKEPTEPLEAVAVTPVKAMATATRRVPTAPVPATPERAMVRSEPVGAEPSSIFPVCAASEPSWDVNAIGDYRVRLRTLISTESIWMVLAAVVSVPIMMNGCRATAVIVVDSVTSASA